MEGRREIMDIFSRKLQSLGITSFTQNIDSIKFSITNQGQSTEDSWRKFLIIIKFTNENFTIMVYFNYNDTMYKFSKDLKSLAVEAITLINNKLHVGKFIYSNRKGTIYLDLTSVYSSISKNWWDSLAHEYIRTALGIYKSFAFAFIKIILGEKNIPLIIKECIKRTNGLITEENSRAVSDEEDYSSPSYDEPDENLQALLQTDFFSNLISVVKECPENCTSGLEYLKSAENQKTFFKVLKEIYDAGVKLENIKLKKVFISENETTFKLYFQKYKYLNAYTKDDSLIYQDYENQILIQYNRELADSFRSDPAHIIKKSSVHMLNKSMFKLTDINSNENVIGTGGFGIVYRNYLFGMPVAIKFPKDNSSESSKILKLISEYKILQSLDHDNIIKTFGFVEDDGCYGIVMEYCGGGGMNTVIRNSQSMKLKSKLDIALKIVKGVEYLHIRGLVHFDLKPHNILIDNNLNPKITDFGLCQRFTEKKLKKTGYTLIYAAPEQVKGINLTTKADVWSFGMTLYYILTGISPYDYLTAGQKRGMDKVVFLNEVYNNKRVPKIPENFELENSGLTKLMRDIWKIEASERPSMKEIRIRLTEIYNSVP